MPASDRAAIGSSRREGVAARGSIARESLRSRLVIDRATFASPSFAMSDRTSISRMTGADLVTMPTGCRARCRTSRTSRTIRICRSIG